MWIETTGQQTTNSIGLLPTIVKTDIFEIKWNIIILIGKSRTKEIEITTASSSSFFGVHLTEKYISLCECSS